MARGINKAILIGNIGNDPETMITAHDMYMLDRSDKSNESFGCSVDSYMEYPEAKTDISAPQKHFDNIVDTKINNPILDDDIPF